MPEVAFGREIGGWRPHPPLICPGSARTATAADGHSNSLRRALTDVLPAAPALMLKIFSIARLAVDGIEVGDAEIIADEISQRVRAGLSGGVAALYPQVA